jgi:hypothetical protein
LQRQPPASNRPPGPPLAQYASVAHVARVYDYLLGGKDNFAADREAAEQAMLINPAVVPTARANRTFLARARAEPTSSKPTCARPWPSTPGPPPRCGPG